MEDFWLALFVDKRPLLGRSKTWRGLLSALLPLIVLQGALQLSWPVIAGVALAFLMLETPAARLAHRVGWRDRSASSSAWPPTATSRRPCSRWTGIPTRSGRATS